MSRRIQRGSAAVGIAALFFITAGCGGLEEGPRPNVFLVTVESLRADHVGAYGYAPETTPNLDRLAREGTLFRDAHAVTSWTLSSHATLFTGLYPSAHRVIEPRHRLADSYVTLAELFRDAGYETAGFVSGPFLRTPHRLSQGFEIYDDSPSAATQEGAHEDVTNPEMERLLTAYFREGPGRERPFFLFAYLWDPHYDFIPPPPYDTMFTAPGAVPFDATGFERNPRIHPNMDPADLKWMIAQYDGEIRCTDDLLGRLFALMEELGLWENTIVAVTADHGEEFFEHGTKGHKNNLFVESVHVPLVVKWADSRPPAEDGRLAGLIDLYETLAAAAGIDGPANHGIDLGAPAGTVRPPFFQELVTTFYGRGPSGRTEKRSEPWWAVRRGPYKLISAAARRINFLYDLSSDPREQRPIETERLDQMGEMLGLLGPWQSEMRAFASRHDEGGEAKLTDEEVDRLRALGYLSDGEDSTGGAEGETGQ
ncbi:MAG: sulfatase [Candidatus Eisenbacteria bacterium]